MPPAWPLRLYYDGACPLCRREIDWLRRRASPERLVPIDLQAERFDDSALPFTREALLTRLHAQDANGLWLIGLDATLASWQAAGLRLPAALLGIRALRPIRDALYRAFCRLRPLLQRSTTANCQAGRCTNLYIKNNPVQHKHNSKKHQKPIKIR